VKLEFQALRMVSFCFEQKQEPAEELRILRFFFAPFLIRNLFFAELRRLVIQASANAAVTDQVLRAPAACLAPARHGFRAPIVVLRHFGPLPFPSLTQYKKPKPVKTPSKNPKKAHIGGGIRISVDRPARAHTLRRKSACAEVENRSVASWL
jgi:hypothetical protein